MTTKLYCLIGWATALLLCGTTTAVTAEDPSVEFNRDVRPLLSDFCFACHGPDKNQRQAELRLDTREGLLGEGDKPGVVRPGRPQDSELYRRVTSDDADERMPPKEFGKVLKPEQIELLQRWVSQGASWQGHWSFQPISRPTPPDVVDDALVSNPIDRFVLRRLGQLDLKSSREADRATLVRRLSLDLTGLPPSPEVLDDFLADTSDRAVDELVDRLLASEHYGERMAMWWLDLVRYADSVGYHGDQPVSIYPFRDYVIRSFNENKPFDRFTLEQLAGDMIPGATLEHQIASGYNRLGMMSAEGGVQPKEYLAKYIAERVRNLGGTWLGLTTGCCECHDHKYDPLSMRDFYSLEAFFADIEERGLYSGAHATGAWGPRVQLPTPEQKRRLTEFDEQIAELRRELDSPTAELAAAQAKWEQSLPKWSALEPATMVASGGATLSLRDDGSVLAGGINPDQNIYVLTFSSVPQDITALRLDVLPDDSLPSKGPGRSDTGNFVLTEIVARFRPAADAAEQPLKFARAAASYEQVKLGKTTPYGKWTAAGAIDGDAKGATFGWAVLEQVGRQHSAVFELDESLSGGEGLVLTVELQHRNDVPRHTIGRFRLMATSSPRPVELNDVPPEIAQVLGKPAEQRSDEERTRLAAHYRTLAPALKPARDKLKELTAARDALDKLVPTTLVTTAVTPRTVRLLPRGNWMDDSGDEMQPAFPAVLPRPEPDAGRRLTRTDLAHWLMARDNPLTARVLVNRMWKLFFGAGLSRKIDDLGSQGEWPTHPDLLDWLAGQFVDSGWDVKRLVRLIVTSRTYRQSSQATPQMQELDPANRLLARQSRYRLDAEIVRDNALTISGLLVPTVGGPSVKPYQPPGYWAHLNFPTREWQNGQGAELYRRGLYTHWQRQYLHPSLLAFDAPSREECVAERSRSNTPLQTLVLLNDPTYVEAARAFAEQLLRRSGESDEQRIAWAFRKALSRPAAPRESAVLIALLGSHRKQYAADLPAAREVLKVGARPAPDDLPGDELAAWTSVTRAILGLYETITRN